MSHKQKTQLDRIEEKLDQLLKLSGPIKVSNEDLKITMARAKEETTPLPKETPFHRP